MWLGTIHDTVTQLQIYLREPNHVYHLTKSKTKYSETCSDILSGMGTGESFIISSDERTFHKYFMSKIKFSFYFLQGYL